jgi:hypothetical protein
MFRVVVEAVFVFWALQRAVFAKMPCAESCLQSGAVDGGGVCVKGWDPVFENNLRPCGPCGPPCGGTRDCGSTEVCCSKTASPYIYQQCSQARLEYLRRFAVEIYSPRYNWFYNPAVTLGESPCLAYKLANCGINVTLLRLDTNIPVCTTTADIDTYKLIKALTGSPCTFRQEYYMETDKRAIYARLIVSPCNQMRIVVLTKDNDEYWPGFDCRLVWNPCYPCRPKLESAA